MRAQKTSKKHLDLNFVEPKISINLIEENKNNLEKKMAIISKPTATATTRRKATVSVFFIITMLALFLLLSVLRISDAFVFVSPGTQHRVSEYDVASKATIISSKSNTLIPSLSFSSQKPIRILRAVQQEQEREQEEKTANTNTNHTNEYERLIYEAERIRLEAEKLDADLTLQKISVLERKLSNNAWLEKQTGQTVKDLYEQLRLLQTKIDCPAVDNGNKVQQLSNRKLSSSSLTTATTTSTLNASISNHESSNNRNIPPIAGFDDDDLDLYVPIAKDVTAIAPNATMEELLQLFRDAPELQEHFKDKIQKMFMGPLEDMQELETLKQEYFDSSSSREREALLKQIRRLEKKNDEQNIDNGESVDGGIAFSDSIKISPEALPPLSQDELDLRYETIKALPDILVAVYLQRNGLYESPVALSTINVNIGGTGDTGFSLNISNANDNGNDLTTTTTTSAINEDVNNIEEKDSSFDLYEDLKLAIQLDYYNLQIQLLIQAQNIEPITEDVKAEFASAFRSLPEDVRKRIAVYNFGVNKFSDTILTSDNDEDVEQITNEILKEQNSPFLQLGSLKDLGNKTKRKNMMIFGNGEKNEQKQQPVVLPEYNDVEFVDRSRYLEEFFPSVALLEDQHPTKENVDLFVAECLSPKNKPFMVTSKPERVIGGYYVRGTNQLLNSLKLKVDDDDNTTTAADMLVQQVNRRLQDHPKLKDKIEFYYILDPSPPTEEDMELGIEPNPIILVTSKDPQTMYGLSAPFTKSVVTLLGLVSPFLFSIGSCALNPKVNNELEKALENGAGVINIQWFYDLSLPLYFSMLGILVAHEIAHRIAASYHKFDIGMPTLIPSLTTGMAGAITPIKSPPPNNKALFDFSIAGPIAGLSVSLVLLFVGLKLTQQMGLDTNLPVLPVDLARASSLGGGMIELFLGKYTLLPDQGSSAYVELHPFAISGFIGCFINALAMLPLGHTDGGRISLTMFGRRGAFVTKLFTTLILCLSGLVGLDNVNILILYVVFTLAWQRELESPVRNEVDELDFTRGLLGIVSAILVGLILIPMT